MDYRDDNIRRRRMRVYTYLLHTHPMFPINTHPPDRLSVSFFNKSDLLFGIATRNYINSGPLCILGSLGPVLARMTLGKIPESIILELRERERRYTTTYRT